MAAVRHVDTIPEMIVRRALHAEKLRFRLHVKDLPGRPDLVFPRYRAVIFVHGCFFHGHDCHLFRWPNSNQHFWKAKIERNIERDSEVAERLRSSGWRIATVWECALKGKTRLDRQDAMQSLALWVRSGGQSKELRGITNWSPHSNN